MSRTVRAAIAPGMMAGFSAGAASFKGDTRPFNDIFKPQSRLQTYQSTLGSALKRWLGEGLPMTDGPVSRSRWNRRDFLKTSAAAAAGAYAMRWGPGLAADVPFEFDGSKFQLAAPEPNPKRGGVLRYGITMRPPHFDVHQSGTINNLGSQGCMFDNLIRRDPRDSGKTIIPDLAHSWEIAKDGKTYTFHLRQGVQFHDGAELTAEDVKATFDRIAKPPQGISSPRTPLFKAIGEINARDKYTVEFKLSEPRPVNFIMSAFASGWNVIVRKRTLEDNNYNLRKVEVYPGTGPFRSVKRVENEIWVMEKNPAYWNKGLPYLDGVEFYHVLPFSPEMASAILSGRVDYVRVTDPVTARKAEATPGMTATDYYQSVIQATWVNNKKKPLDDPRVRRAMHLVLDKPVLVEVVKDVAPMMFGGFIYPFSEFATPKEKLNIDCNLRTVVDSVWFDDAKSGNFDLAIGAIVSALLDPSDYFNAWYGKDGPQNYSFWDNKDFQALAAQIDREVDAEKRQDLIRQAETIMEQDPPLLPVSWEKINDVWYNYVKGHNPYEYFGIYDVVRLDTVWLDKS